MLPNNNVSTSVGHLDHVLTVYSSMEHVTWKSPGPMCGWVDRTLHPRSCISVSCWSKVPLLSIWSVAVPLCRPLLPRPSRWHGSLPRHGLWWLTCELHCSALPCQLRSVYRLWKLFNTINQSVLLASLQPEGQIEVKYSWNNNTTEITITTHWWWHEGFPPELLQCFSWAHPIPENSFLSVLW